MSRITLSGGFTPIPEGTHIFKIVSVEYKEEFGKLAIVLETADGKRHTERYQLVRDNGTPNEGAIKSFSFLARTALQDGTVEDIDPEDLLGCYIECDVSHDVQPNRNDPTKTVTFVRLGDKRQADGYAGSTPAAPTAPAAPKAEALDLASLLG